MVIFEEKHYDTSEMPMIELIEMVENTQHLNHYKLWYLFLYFGIFHSKSVIMLVLCPALVKNKI